MSELHSAVAATGDRAGLAAAMVTAKEDGRIKLYLIHCGLEHRRRRGGLYRDGAYVPRAPHGSRAEHVIAFGRRLGGDAVIAVAPRFIARLHLPGPLVGQVWAGTWLALPDGWGFRAFRNVLTGETVDVAAREGRPGLALETALGIFPVALLEAVDEP